MIQNQSMKAYDERKNYQGVDNLIEVSCKTESDYENTTRLQSVWLMEMLSTLVYLV